MSDLSKAKPPVGAVFPENATESPFIRTEPLLTAQQLRQRFLFGIPLVGLIRDPINGQFPVVTDDMLTDTILRATNQLEMESGLDIFPVERHEKHPFLRADYEQFAYFRLKNRPVSNMLRLTVTPANGTDIYVIPNEWIETAYMATGQINIVPITIALIGGGTIPANSAGGAAFLSILSRNWFTPAFWQINYISGFDEGHVPKMVNELIGIIAAMDILSMLAATIRHTSQSLSIDGLGQSSTTPGPLLYMQRIQQMMLKKEELLRKLKMMYGLNFFSNDV